MSEWISVEDRLPELLPTDLKMAEKASGEVIVAYHVGNGEMGVSWGELMSSNGRVFWGEQELSRGRCSEIYNVTHWQPFPAPPEGE